MVEAELDVSQIDLTITKNESMKWYKCNARQSRVEMEPSKSNGIPND